MASFDDGAVSIHYDVAGDGYPVLLIAPGGMRSEAQKWSAMPYDPITELSGTYRTIAMDQRNAGRSRGPIAGDHGWHTYRDDQLALLDHLGVERCHVVGMCIGGPFIVGLLRAAPERFSAAVLLQPVGISDNREAFHDIFDGWRAEQAGDHPDLTDPDWTSFRDHMWGGDFVLTATPDEVAQIDVPMLVAMGNDLYHPAATSREIAARVGAPLVESWKEGEALAAFRLTAAEFLAEHTP